MVLLDSQVEVIISNGVVILNVIVGKDYDSVLSYGGNDVGNVVVLSRIC